MPGTFLDEPGAGPDPVDPAAIRSFWEREPVAARAVPYPSGTPEFFDRYDVLREQNESPAFSAWLHDYAQFAGKRVLDIGCGNGYVLERYARAGARAVGIDVTRRAVELSRARFRHRGCDVRLLQADAQRLPFDDGRFDCVCSMGVLHHVPSTEQALAEIRRVLRPGGRLILMMYHRDSWIYRVQMPLRRTLSPRHRGKSLATLVNEVDGEGNPLGRVYSRSELAALLGGFSDLEFRIGQMLPADIPVIGRFLPRTLLRWAERRFGWFLYVKARRSAEPARPACPADAALAAAVRRTSGDGGGTEERLP